MANTITEKDIINHLQEKIKFHQHEARRLENVLTAFITDGSAQLGQRTNKEVSSDAASTADDQPAITEHKNKKNAVAKKPVVPATPVKALDVPEKYTDELTINAKIAFALNEIGAGFNEEIANAMAQYEPKSDAKTISRQISGVLSTLKAKGQLKTEKVGRKDRFSLP